MHARRLLDRKNLKLSALTGKPQVEVNCSGSLGAQKRKQAETSPVPPSIEGEDLDHTPLTFHSLIPPCLLLLLSPQVHLGEEVSLLPCMCPRPRNPVRAPEEIT